MIISLFVLANAVLGEAPFASSNVEIVEDSVNIGVDYKNFNDDKQDTISENTDAITIKNNNNEEVRIVFSAKDLPTDYAAGSIEVTIPANGTITPTLSINVSHEKDSGKENIGSLVIKGVNGVELDTATLVQDTLSMLNLKELEIEYNNKNGNSERDSFDDLVDATDYKLDSEVQAGSVMRFTFDLENLFDNNYDEDDAEIEDIVIKIDPSDNDLFEDYDDEIDMDNIAAEDSDSLTIELTLSSDLDDDTYDIDFEIEGDDGKGSTHSLTFNLEFEIEHAKDDVRIVRAEVSPETITTCTEQISLNLKVENLGSDDQSFVDVSIYNEELEIDEKWGTFKLYDFNDDDNSKTQAFLFDVSKLSKKTYNLEVYAYIDTDDLMDYEVVSFSVGECLSDVPEVTEVEEEEESTVIVTALNPEGTDTNDSETQQVSSSTVVATTESSYTTEDFLIGAVIIAIILIVALIIVFFVVLLK